jgi:hypothetical protein
MKITVYHDTISGNGDHTVFEGGSDLNYYVNEHGGLQISKWRTQTETGTAYFAPGKWTFICHSKPS